MDYGNVMTAMVTPFKNEDINIPEAIAIAKHLEKHGSDSILLVGSTGECPTLSNLEKLKLVEAVKENVDIPVIVGTGTNGTKNSIKLTKEVDKIGIDGFLIVTPYYNKPNQRGIYEHFKAISNSTNTEIIIYNIPGRCATNIEVDTILKLSKIKNINTLKAACGNFDNISKSIQGTGSDFHVYSGDDSLTLPMLAIGATGVISVASSIIGEDINDMIKSYKNGEVRRALDIYNKSFGLFRDLFCDTNPVPIKYAMRLLGFEAEKVRLPLVPLLDEDKKIITSRLKSMKLI